MRYSCYSAQGADTAPAYHGIKEALFTLQALATEKKESLVPLRGDAFFTDLFAAVSHLIDGDIQAPIFPSWYIAGKEEGMAAVFALTYAAFRKKTADCLFLSEVEGEELRLIAEGKPRFVCDEKSTDGMALLFPRGAEITELLHCVARESGLSFSVTAGERLSLAFRMRRFRAQVQLVHAKDVERASRMMQTIQKLLPLTAQTAISYAKRFL